MVCIYIFARSTGDYSFEILAEDGEMIHDCSHSFASVREAEDSARRWCDKRGYTTE